jgi:hypothetical protein
LRETARSINIRHIRDRSRLE